MSPPSVTTELPSGLRFRRLLKPDGVRGVFPPRHYDASAQSHDCLEQLHMSVLGSSLFPPDSWKKPDAFRETGQRGSSIEWAKEARSDRAQFSQPRCSETYPTIGECKVESTKARYADASLA